MSDAQHRQNTGLSTPQLFAPLSPVFFRLTSEQKKYYTYASFHWWHSYDLPSLSLFAEFSFTVTVHSAIALTRGSRGLARVHATRERH